MITSIEVHMNGLDKDQASFTAVKALSLGASEVSISRSDTFLTGDGAIHYRYALYIDGLDQAGVAALQEN